MITRDQATWFEKTIGWLPETILCVTGFSGKKVLNIGPSESPIFSTMRTYMEKNGAAVLPFSIEKDNLSNISSALNGSFDCIVVTIPSDPKLATDLNIPHNVLFETMKRLMKPAGKFYVVPVGIDPKETASLMEVAGKHFGFVSIIGGLPLILEGRILPKQPPPLNPQKKPNLSLKREEGAENVSAQETSETPNKGRWNL